MLSETLVVKMKAVILGKHRGTKEQTGEGVKMTEIYRLTGGTLSLHCSSLKLIIRHLANDVR